MNTLIAKVISTKMQQTVVVQLDRLVEHPKYNKRMRKTVKFHAHCEIPVKMDDMVKIQQVRPISKTKNWKVLEVVK
jgi:small subunit ribosomal protein S17